MKNDYLLLFVYTDGMNSDYHVIFYVSIFSCIFRLSDKDFRSVWYFYLIYSFAMIETS